MGDQEVGILPQAVQKVGFQLEGMYVIRLSFLIVSYRCEEGSILQHIVHILAVHLQGR